MCATDIDLSCPLASMVLRAEEHTQGRKVVPIPMAVIVCPLPGFTELGEYAPMVGDCNFLTCFCLVLWDKGRMHERQDEERLLTY